MLIQINANYRITSDPNCFVVEQRKIAGKDAKNPGEERWVQLSYHHTLEQAVNWTANKQIKISDAEGVQQLLEEIRGYRKDLKVSVGLL